MRSKIVKKTKAGKITEKREIWTVDLSAWISSGWEVENEEKTDAAPQKTSNPVIEDSRTIEVIAEPVETKTSQPPPLKPKEDPPPLSIPDKSKK